MKIFISIILITFSSLSFGCVEPNDEKVELVGEVKTETFPGRPNYESIEKGDEPETVWILTIKNPICFNGIKEKQKRFHLFWLGTKKHIKSAGRYKITGKTMESHTGHHHTPVLIEVEHAVQP